ncbi:MULTISPECIES: hypothetical protein [Polymorphospora]|uniref:Uncharacterized protein n=1 Tax=Polymorphospora lycopeni TaxID=3140240 RepID=A0ABV5CTU4_9ACTN
MEGQQPDEHSRCRSTSLDSVDGPPTDSPPASEPGPLPWLRRCQDLLVTKARGNQTNATDRHRDLCWSHASDLGSAMLEYARHTGDDKRLDNAIELLEHAWSQTSVGSAPRQTVAARLGLAFYTRFQRSGRIVDLDTIIARLDGAAGEPWSAVADATDERPAEQLLPTADLDPALAGQPAAGVTGPDRGADHRHSIRRITPVPLPRWSELSAQLAFRQAAPTAGWPIN